MAVELIEVNAAVSVELWDLEVGVRGEEVVDRLVERLKQ